ncbi:MAG TPA: redoxin domain-containing protein [Steroidobacteraceae bacterium]|jgi:thiol-disulfide isomerase/thioredoxin|nr:redoxin domain-containing protein [Steroidobacteraceae bacterium]
MRKGAYWVGIVGAICSMLIAAAAQADSSGEARAKSAAQPILGSPAPRVTLKTIDGETIDLGGLYGKKAVYLKFWATWCVPCRQQMPHFEHAYETAGTDLAVIAINVGFNDSLDAIQRYRKQLGITMPIVLDDGSLGAAFRLRVTPTHIVIGRDGRIQYVGHLADAQLDDALKKARGRAGVLVAAGKGRAAVAMRETPSIAVGDALPAQSLRTIDGQRFSMRPLDSGRRFTALVFLSPWCESYLATSRPKVAENCRNMRMQVSGLANDPRVRWLGVASGLWADAADLRKYRQEQQVTIPLTLDASGNIFREFRVNDVPTVLIADAHGKLLRRIEGDAASDPKTLTDALSNL